MDEKLTQKDIIERANKVMEAVPCKGDGYPFLDVPIIDGDGAYVVRYERKEYREIDRFGMRNWFIWENPKLIRLS